MNAHTSGPWSISKHATPAYAQQFGIYANGLRNDHVIVTGENAKADAQLIASTPALLALCDEAQELLDVLADDIEGFYPARSKNTANLARRLRSAIALAKASQ